MGLFGGFQKFANRLGMLRRDEAQQEKQQPHSTRRARVFETVEPRIMLNGIGVFDPIEVGAVYIEGDTGHDGTGDTIEITFNGGGPNTQLDRVIISGNKAFDYNQFLQDGLAGELKNLHVFFDTISTGEPGDNFGKDLGSPFQVIDAAGIDNFSAQVVDGTSLLILNFEGFDAGEKFVFKIDVDQVIDLNEDPVSEGLDAITSGVEFQNSTLAVEFSAPGFNDASATGKFKDSYDRFLVDRTLNLTPDDGLDPNNTIRDRTAGVAFDVEQDPLPITISGTVFHDRDLDLLQDRSLDPQLDEDGIDGVELQLWKLNNDTGLYDDTGHRATTADGGHYEFGADLDLTPGVFEVREGDAAGYFDVGAIPGEVNGTDVGERGETDPPPLTTAGEYDRHYNVLTRIEIPLGGQHGVNYDFAEAKLAEVSGFVYHDRNDNGLKETGEEGLGSIRMLIQPADWPLPETGTTPTPIDYGPGNGHVTAIATTNPDGSYKFENMRPGTYRIIQLDQPAGFNDGLETAGQVDGANIGTAINPLEPGRIDDIVLVSDSIGVEYNFGEHKPASIYGNVHLSTPDGDCFGDLPDQTFEPVAGAKVELWNADGTELLETTFTDEHGDYSFSNLAIGTYRVREYTPSELLDGDEHVGEVQGVGIVGAITGIDATVGYDEISGITLFSDQIGVHYDFCEHVPASISGYVYHDINDDGVKDPHPLVTPTGEVEPGIAGVTMTLVDTTTNQVVATTTTNDAGFYRFDNLHAGTYRVVEGDPGPMWTDGKDRAGFVLNDAGIADPRGTAVETDTIQNINLLYGDDGERYDFGEIKLAAIHGRVQLSTPDGDCFGDEPTQHRPVVGAKVELWNADGTELLETTVTDDSGDYWFMNLRPGEYTVREYTPDDLLDGDEHVGEVGGVGIVGAVTGTDAVVGYDEISGIKLLSGQEGEHYDFCEHEPAKISGFVYHDRDNDGVKETGEEGIAGVTMSLIDLDTGLVIGTTQTDATGMYMFSDLLAGNYKVQEGDPGPQWIDGIDTEGTIVRDGVRIGRSDSTDVGNEMETDMIIDVHLLGGDRGEDYNFGEYLPGSISGVVYLSDPFGNCELEPGQTPDRPLAGVKISLYDGAIDPANLVATTLTNELGEYSFDGLAPGSYTVVEETPADLLDGHEHVGSHGGIVIDPDNRNSVIGDITLTSGDDGIEYDFCESEPAKISGFVYHDRNINGIKEAGEEGIADVTMSLIDLDTGLVVATTQTDGTGMYMFGDLLVGNYKVQEGDPGAQWIDGIDTEGTILRNGVLLTRGDSTDVGDDLERDMIVDIRLLNGDRGENYNFGEYKQGSIAGRVFLADPFGDCELEPGQTPDRPLAGVKISLYDGAVEPANLIATTVTNVLGEYRFDGLNPGNYTVVEETPADLLDGHEHVGSHGGIVIDPDNRNSVIGDITLTSGDDGIEYDFCESEPAKIAGFVYHDRDNDGAKEAGEEGIAGVTMSLIDLDTGLVVATTETDETGMYMFGDLRVGNYKVQEGDPGPQWIDGIDTEGTLLRSGVLLDRTDTTDVGDNLELDMIVDIHLLNGDRGENYNFGEYLPGSIQGYVFVHPSGECLLLPEQAPADGLEGITIELVDAGGNVVRTTQTLADGSYRFDLLPPGTYTVREGATAGYFDGDDSVGYRTLPAGFDVGPGNDLVDDQLRGILISSGDAMVHYNFCEAPPASISGFVFQDGAPVFSPNGLLPADIEAQRDGLRTADDTPIAGVTLELRYTFGGDAVQASDTLPGTYASGPLRTTTDANGFYEFTGLRAGNYTVIEVHPAGYFDHLDTAGTRDGALNGVAINRVSDLSPAIFTSWSTNPPLDTIALIGLPAGSQAVENNFSEVKVYTIPIIPPPETPLPPPPPVVVTSPIVLPQPLFLSTYLPPPVAAPVPQVGSGDAYSWHLSVIDAGQPRQVAEAGNAPFFTASLQMHVTAWDGQQTNDGVWTFAGIEKESLFGLEGAIPIAGDFNGDGVDEIGVYLDGEWYIDLNANGVWDSDDLWARLGEEGDRPVVGDWDGDGKDDIGIFGPMWARDLVAIRHDPGLPDQHNPHFGKPKNLPPEVEEATDGARAMQRSQRGAVRRDLIDHVFLYGQARDIPVAGDWNGDGIRTIGTFNNGYWHLDSDGDGRFTKYDQSVKFGEAGDLPVVGDFNNDGVDELGIYRGGTWIMDTNGNREIDAADKVFELGGADDLPVAGDWNGDGADEPAVYRSGRPERVAAQPRG